MSYLVGFYQEISLKKNNILGSENLSAIILQWTLFRNAHVVVGNILGSGTAIFNLH